MGEQGEDSINHPEFSARRSIKLGTFHIGSSMADLLTSAVWNRIMIVDIGVVAWPVALLSALRYLLAPLSLWAGHRSDTHPIFGSRRVAYIWIGRLLMLVALPLLPFSVVIIGRDSSSPIGWAAAIGSFLLFGVGTLVSGPPFLALVHDSAPYEKRGQAISIVQLILVVSFAFVPAIYAQIMQTYSPEAFARLIVIAAIGAAIFWLFSVWGEERATAGAAMADSDIAVRGTFAAIWSDTRTRRYAVFLATSAFFAFMQDAVLEPFGGDVFDLTAGETTRFNAFWGTGVLVGMVGTLVLTRRLRPHQQGRTTAIGLALLGAPLLMLGLVSLLEALPLVMPVLIAFGFGFGVFAIGGVSLLMAMSAEDQAASYLALWSVVQLVARGAGIATGGLLRDASLALTGQFHTVYATVYVVEALGIFFSIVLLARVDVEGFASQRADFSSIDFVAASVD